MNNEFAAAMRRATLSTHAMNFTEATRVIQDALAERAAAKEPGPAPDIMPPAAKKRPKPFSVDPNAEVVEPSTKLEPAGTRTYPSRPLRPRRSLAETLRMLDEGQASDSSVRFPAADCPV
ncbi:hypothetical protein [Pararhizobium sp. PWRC1-1]|uniref:hypothetical protein n=1 Tax=Pararhizobium sp. PWRC1-1 TaxID=2804566 RepID=UPI003CF3EFC8